MAQVTTNLTLAEVGVGQVIEAVTTDPGSLTDFPAWAKTSGNQIFKTEQSGKEIRFSSNGSTKKHFCFE